METRHRIPNVEFGLGSSVPEDLEPQPEMLYSWRGQPLARHGDDLHLSDGRWWGRILPTAFSVFDEHGAYVADVLNSDRIATDPWKREIRANNFKHGWDEFERPPDQEAFDPPLREGADLGPPRDPFREPPLFPYHAELV